MDTVVLVAMVTKVVNTQFSNVVSTEMLLAGN